jgi:hypothetical protein
MTDMKPDMNKTALLRGIALGGAAFGVLDPRSPPTPQMANGARHAMWSRVISARQMLTLRPSQKSPSGRISANPAS